ncbi:TPA: hypothetical protein DIT45_02380 [Candidatus Acetothermia bacterium]|nr:hypothetical protein [Candidatus Acetothermia bacterium]
MLEHKEVSNEKNGSSFIGCSPALRLDHAGANPHLLPVLRWADSFLLVGTLAFVLLANTSNKAAFVA